MLIAPLLAALLLGSLPCEAAMTNQEKVLALKTAYIYNFIKYCTWPESRVDNDNSPLFIGVIGHHELADHLEGLTQKKKHGNHPLILLRIPYDENSQSGNEGSQVFRDLLASCHVAYFSCELDQLDWNQITEIIHTRSILTVGDCDFAPHMIRFANDGDRIEFEVDLDEVKAANLKLSSKLLKLRKIQGGGKR
jgi:YfiR/HmsC-like